MASGPYHAASGAAVGGALGGGASAGVGLYEGKDWSEIGSDALAGAGWGTLQGGLGGFTRGYYSFAKACFTAGTPIVVDLEGNSRAIEELEVGDTVLARSEFDPAGLLELKRIEEKFIRAPRR